MPDKDYTHIVIVLDSSSSMSSIKSATEEALNSFIKTQREQPGRATVTYVTFSTTSKVVHELVNLKHVGTMRLEPNGMTALYDAVCDTIDSTGRVLKGLPEDLRPGLVLFAIVTDGQENASTRSTAADVARRIEHQTSAYNWQFTYLGANQDAILEAGKMGIRAQAASSYNAANVEQAVRTCSSILVGCRADTSRGLQASYSYSDQQRVDMMQDPATLPSQP